MKKISNYMQLIVISCIWGFNIVLMKYLSKTLAYSFMAAYRVVISFIFLYFITNKKDILTKKNNIILFFIAMINISGYMTLSNLAISLSETKNIAFITVLTPMFTAIISRYLAHKKLSNYTKVSILLSAFGAIGIYINNGSALTLGDGIMIIAIIMHCLSYVLIEKYSQQIPSETIAYKLFQYGMWQIVIFNLIFYRREILTFDYPISILILFALSSIIGYCYCQVMYQKQVSILGSIKASFFLNLNPIFTLIGSIIFLQERVSFVELLCFLVILCGVYISTKEKSS